MWLPHPTFQTSHNLSCLLEEKAVLADDLQGQLSAVTAEVTQLFDSKTAVENDAVDLAEKLQDVSLAK